MCDFVTTEIIKTKNHNIKTYCIRNRSKTDLISLIAIDACPLSIMEIKGTEIYKRKTNKHKNQTATAVALCRRSIYNMKQEHS